VLVFREKLGLNVLWFGGGLICGWHSAVGYKSRADEKSWNGANRKVLETEIAAHLAKFERIPNVHGRVEKIGVRVDAPIAFLVQIDSGNVL